ncbi:DUF6708 domain-containing protein [Photobacterium damselae]|uniref:DUF6708 domain-containing protein n=1 Tax=Photobacterium damselae TaxID=38293 RepID=UPI0025430912|nr:DUF6708 domain-containing protein [Photobacterium damselae]WIH20214.1 hypothetical protein KQY33_04785 [Photobacterium damselae]
MTHSFNYFAGQLHTDYGTQTSVLSPLPVLTGLDANDSEYLAKKNNHYIDIGGVVGTVFQTQLYVSVCLMVLCACIWLDYLVKNGTGNHFFFNIDNLINIDIKTNPMAILSLEIIQFLLIMLIPISWFSLLFMLSTRDLRRQLPLRFHRQRREVMFSRWNKKTRKIETKVVPWEEVIAFVNCNKLFLGAGVMAQSVLVIGANDETQENTSWASIALSSISPLMVAKHWEMIRRFMEEGSDAIGQPKPTTFKGLMEEYCLERDIPLEQFPAYIRFWWEINFTRLGLLATRYRMWRCYKHPRKHAEFEAWSQPIPESEWVKPSKELIQLNERLTKRYQNGDCSSLLDAGLIVELEMSDIKRMA